MKNTTTSSLSRRALLQAMAALPLTAPLAAPLSAFAQAAGSGRIISGFAAGGGADLAARAVVDKMRETLGWNQLVVENRTGAAGKIALDAMRAATPDGRTLLIAPLVTPVLAQLTFKNPGYDPARDMVPVGMVGHFQFSLAVPAAHPAKNMAELVKWLKANPSKANYGSPSPGSLPQFFGIMLGRAIGVPMVHVGYKGGAHMVNDLAGGQIPVGINTEGDLLELHRGGKIRILATFAPKRTPQMPDIPSMVELGYKDAVGSAWYSLWTTPGTPSAQVSALNQALNVALNTTLVKARLFAQGVEAAPGTPQELEAKRLADIAKWKPIIEASGFKAD